MPGMSVSLAPRALPSYILLVAFALPRVSGRMSRSACECVCVCVCVRVLCVLCVCVCGCVSVLAAGLCAVHCVFCVVLCVLCCVERQWHLPVHDRGSPSIGV